MGIFRAASPDSPAAAEFDAFLSRNVNEVLRRDAIGGAALGFISSGLLAVLLLTGSARDLWMPVIEARACGAGSLGIRAPTRRNLLCEPLGEVKVKGKANAVRIYGARGAGTGTGAGAARVA